MATPQKTPSKSASGATGGATGTTIASSAGASNVVTPTIVVTPKIGGISTHANPNGTVARVPWVGGKPSKDWDLMFNTEPKTPFCFQPLRPLTS